MQNPLKSTSNEKLLMSQDLNQAQTLRFATSATADHHTWTYKGVSLSFQDTGMFNDASTKPVIVCLHAIGHGSGDYAEVVERLRDRYRLIALDWPGQGRSEGVITEPDFDPSVTGYAALLDQFLKHLCIEKMILIGNSVGGGAALLYASRNLEKVIRIVVSNPAGSDKGGLMGQIFTWWMSQRFIRAQTQPQGFMRWFAGYYAKVLPMESAKEQRSRIVVSGLEIAPILARAWRNFAKPENDIRQKLRTLTMPVLVAWAKQDKLVRWSRNRQALMVIPIHEVMFFEAGHTPFLEQPDQFMNALELFLEEERTINV
jgi:pimeloyl-ACP methyl ester carboxylesterase